MFDLCPEICTGALSRDWIRAPYFTPPSGSSPEHPKLTLYQNHVLSGSDPVPDPARGLLQGAGGVPGARSDGRHNRGPEAGLHALQPEVRFSYAVSTTGVSASFLIARFNKIKVLQIELLKIADTRTCGAC